MKTMKKLFILVIVLSTFSRAQDDNGDIKFSGYASYQAGQVMSGTFKTKGDIDKYWLQKVFANVGFVKGIDDWLTITASLEASYQSSFKQANTFPETERYISDIAIDEAKGDFILRENEKLGIDLTIGYFHYRYNEDVYNLGNNLFKSYCYPTAIVQPEFDFPYSRLCGINLRAKVLDSLLFNDLMFTTHLFFYPTGDWSVADIVGIRPFRGVKVGGGVQLDRIFPIESDITTPKSRSRKVDPLTPGDTTFYTYAGTKLMFHLNLDVKKILFGDDYPQILGVEDGKLWFEADLLGIKDYYYFYEKLNERMIYSMGILLPAFKVLDVLALEFEYFPSRYPNSIIKPMNSNLPQPDIQESGYNPEDYKEDDWKWSLYAKKSISEHFHIIGFVGKDHLQLWALRDVERIYRDNLLEKGDWYYQLKMMFTF